MAGVLMPPVILAIPQYLLLAKADITDSYASVLLPLILSPYGIYLARIYAAAAVPADVVEAGRMDGAGEWRIFTRVALPMMVPGLVTVFLFQFVAVWNNFLLPYIMLGDDEKFPITLGLFTLLEQGATTPALYTLVITGALLAIIPLIALFLVIQRFWSLDLLSGAVKSMTMSNTGGRRRPPTIHDVAREAGVSRGTVSRVLNGGHYVSPTAHEAVQRRHPQDGLRREPARPFAHHRPLRLGRLPADGASGAVLRGPELQCPAARLHPGAGGARHPAAADAGGHGGRTAPHHAVHHRRSRRRRAAGLQPLR